MFIRVLDVLRVGVVMGWMDGVAVVFSLDFEDLMTRFEMGPGPGVVFGLLEC